MREILNLSREVRGEGADRACDEIRGSMQDLMKGKRGLIMGVANDHSIAWGIAKALAAQGAELAFTYQGEALGKRVRPLAQSLGVPLVLPCDVDDIASVDAVFETLREKWGHLDFLVHAIGFTDKNELRGRYADTTRENFSRTMVISCFSFTEVAKRAARERCPAVVWVARNSNRGAVGFYKSLAAVQHKESSQFILAGEALARLAKGAA